VIGLLVVAFVSAPPPPAASPWVTLSGQIVWPKGKDLPDPPVVTVTTDKQHCCGAGPLFDETYVVDRTSRGIKGVIVWLRPDNDDPKSVFPKDRIHPDLVAAKPAEHTIDTPRCQFVPRVMVVRAGDVLKAKNSAPVAHNLHLEGVANEINRLIPANQDAIKVVESFKLEPQVSIPIRDAIHPWMKGSIKVFDHPYYAVTDADGRFEIPKVPVGVWRIVYWHEQGYHKGRDGRLGFRVDVKDKGAAKHALPPLEYEFPKID
jgi:hypothetical protein